MKRGKKIILLAMLATLTITASVACTKQNEKEETTTPESSLSGETESERAPESSSEETEQNTLPADILLPKDADVYDEENGMLAETEEYWLYCFAADSGPEGALYNVTDAVSVLNAEGEQEEAKKLLRLKDYRIDEKEEASFYERINGRRGFFLPLMQISLKRTQGDPILGDGFAMIYDRPDDIGVYIVVGILKSKDGNSSEQDQSARDSAINTALNLFPEEETARYDIWEGELSDETELRLAYKAGTFSKIEQEENELFLTFRSEADKSEADQNGSDGNETDQDGSGQSESAWNEPDVNILIRHTQMRGDIPAKDHLQAMIDEFKQQEDITASEIESFKGKMEYQSSTLSYIQGETEKQEIICLGMNEEGSVWIVDLCGTPDGIKAHRKDLETILWSLEEE